MTTFADQTLGNDTSDQPVKTALTMAQRSSAYGSAEKRAFMAWTAVAGGVCIVFGLVWGTVAVVAKLN